MSILNAIICTIKAIPEVVTYESAEADELDCLVEALRKTLWSIKVEQRMRDRAAARRAPAPEPADAPNSGGAA